MPVASTQAKRRPFGPLGQAKPKLRWQLQTEQIIAIRGHLRQGSSRWASSRRSQEHAVRRRCQPHRLASARCRNVHTLSIAMNGARHVYPSPDHRSYDRRQRDRDSIHCQVNSLALGNAMSLRSTGKSSRDISAAEAAGLVNSGDWIDYGITFNQPDVFDASACRANEPTCAMSKSARQSR